MHPYPLVFFGALGDRIGRRKVLYITLLSIGIATAAIGALPTYATIGALAPALLVLCRLVQGFSAGGESVGAPTFVFEHAPVHRRGYWLNITLAATALPSVVAGTLILVLSKSMSDDAFTSWGWRIPFLLALPAAFFGLWIRLRTEESEVFQRIKAETAGRKRSPIRQAFRENKVRMLQVVFVLGLTAMGFYSLAGYFVTYVQTAGGLSREQSLLLNAAAMTAYTVRVGAAYSVLEVPAGAGSDQDVLDHFDEVFAAVDMPFVIFNPGKPGTRESTLSLKTFAALCERPNVKILKTTADPGFNNQLRDVAKGTGVRVSDPLEEHFFENLLEHGQALLYCDPEGYLYQSAHHRPIEEYIRLCGEGRVQQAKEVFDSLAALRKVYRKWIIGPLENGHMPNAALKKWCELSGMAGGSVRHPLKELTAAESAELEHDLKQALGSR
ncbi:MFS transporter [Streptomyces sp. NPDC002838]|uniref:MFS transporter n=1 Tax=Streptomyces sp. NPDC002838 TaxID=3154436 RepID=UPI003328D911